jgi:hypothetical protein
MRVRDNENGTYTVAYTPEIGGDYFISVMINGVHIQDRYTLESIPYCTYRAGTPWNPFPIAHTGQAHPGIYSLVMIRAKHFLGQPLDKIPQPSTLDFDLLTGTSTQQDPSTLNPRL